ncbi:hypothetical protein Trydic_g15823 [Trypoxylus dichotomus]
MDLDSDEGDSRSSASRANTVSVPGNYPETSFASRRRTTSAPTPVTASPHSSFIYDVRGGRGGVGELDFLQLPRKAASFSEASKTFCNPEHVRALEPPPSSPHLLHVPILPVGNSALRSPNCPVVLSPPLSGVPTRP